MSELDTSQKTALCAAIRTSRYAKKVISLLRDLSEDLYKTDIENPLNNLDTSMDDELARVFNELLSNIDRSNPMEAEQALRAVIDYIKTVEEIGFVVPIHPKNEFVERLYSWCSENISNEVLIDFTTNRLMESGLLMIYKGRYFEYSLENLLNDYLSTHELGVYFDRVAAGGQGGQDPGSQQQTQKAAPEENTVEQAADQQPSDQITGFA